MTICEKLTVYKVLLVLFVSLAINMPGCRNAKTTLPEETNQPSLAEEQLLQHDEPQPSSTVERNAMSAESEIPLFDYLYDMGEALDCYFTAERMASTATYSSPLESSVIEPDTVTSINDLVDKLNNDLSGLTATRSTEWPEVIHLVEDALGNVTGYAIEEEVTLEFSGTVHNLILQLGQELSGKIGRTTGGTLPPGPFDVLYDTETETEIDVEDETVRKVLTGAVPHEDYNRVLWGATTRVTNGDHHVQASFGGPPDEEEE